VIATSGAFLVAKCLMGCKHRFCWDSDLGVGEGIVYLQGCTIDAATHSGGTVWFKVKVYPVEGALSELEEASRDPEKVAP
jgi:hypothetical protein